MSHGRPSLAELRATVQKQKHREIGNWLARRVARPTAVYGSWVAVRLGCSAHQVTLAALAASLGGAIAIGTGSRAGFMLGLALAHLGFWLDHVDGQVARWRGTACLDGVYLDYVMHHVGNLSLGFGLGFGLASRSGQPAWALAGFAIAGGWALLSLHNDCRYKAFFQRLKSASGTYHRRRRQRRSAFTPGVLAQAWHRTLELAFIQGVRAARGLDNDHGFGCSGRPSTVALAVLLANRRSGHGRAGPLVRRCSHRPLGHQRNGGSRVRQVVPSR